MSHQDPTEYFSFIYVLNNIKQTVIRTYFYLSASGENTIYKGARYCAQIWIGVFAFIHAIKTIIWRVL